MSLRTRLLLLLTSGAIPLLAQDGENWYRENRVPVAILNVAVDLGISSSQFAQNMNNRVAAGSNLELLIRLKKRHPVWAGLGYRAFAWDADEIAYTQQIDNEFYNYEERTVSRIAQVHGLLRFQPEVRWILQPYVQGAAGLHWYYTNTKILDVDYDEVVEKITESREVIPGFALHAGMQFVPRKLPDVRIDARLGYLNNASIEYLRYNPNLPVGNYPIDSFEAKNSPIEILDIQIGVTIVIKSASDEDKE